MYKVIYDDVFFLSLEEFIISYSAIFEKLYHDTGIQDEYIIVENYQKISKQFKETILKRIHTQLSSKVVLGRRVGSNINSIILQERSFLIIVDYTEDTTNQTRYVENIIFTKK